MDLGLTEMWSSRELLYFFVWKEVKIRYKQTVIGALWAVLQPLMTMIIFTFFFGSLLNAPSEGIPYPVFAYSGLILWTYFSNSVGQSSNSLIANSNLVSKVYFPRTFIPLSLCLTGLIDFVIALSIAFALILYFGVAFTPMMVLLLVPLLITFVLASGLALWLSAINVKYRDVAYIVPFFIQLLFFATPVVYASSLIPSQYSWIITANPLSGLFSLQRGVLLGTPVDWGLVAISTTLAIVIFVTGLIYFRRYERRIADVI